MGLFDKLFSKKETESQRAEWLNGALNQAVSKVQNNHMAEIRTAKRSFEAAETPPWTESWATNSLPVNDELSRQLPTLRSRARGLARNNEWAIRYLLQLDDNILGEPGIRLQMRLTKPDGSRDDVKNNLIETAWAKWGEYCEVSGKCFREAESLALSGLPIDGEILYRLRPGAGKFGFQIQLLDPALIDVSLHREWNGNRIRMGVEITDDGLPVAYWLKMSRSGEATSDIITVGKHARVPADQLRHKFLSKEVGQVRGYPWLAAGARRLFLLSDFEEAAAVASSNAAKRQGFFFTPSGEAPPGFADTVVSGVLEAAKASGKVLTAEEIQQLVSAAEKYTTTVPGQFDTLPGNTQFQPFESKWPDIDASSHIKSHLRGWTAARGMSYVTLGNDLESVNYSSAQVGIVGEREHFKTIQGQLKRWFHQEIFEAALPYLILKTPGLSMGDAEKYLDASSWQPRRWQPVDPVKTANANETNIRLGLTSRRRIIMERGDDPDEVAAEVDAEIKIYGQLATPGAAPPKADISEEDKAVEEKRLRLVASRKLI